MPASHDQAISRRDFLRLRRTEQGKVLDVSCRAMFMRCADAAIVSEPVDEWEPWMGEPPAVITRRSADEILESFERDLADVQVLRLLEPEWLDNIAGAARVQAAIAAFRARGGVVEAGAA
ncbi:MAG: hypothetical protein QM736_27755 [Vicinamibacterales bacterium]